jgi:hypothetical protein
MEPMDFTGSLQTAAAELGARDAVVIRSADTIAQLRDCHSSTRGGRSALISRPSAAAVARGSSMQRRRPNKPLQPTRAVAAIAMTGGARFGPRG